MGSRWLPANNRAPPCSMSPRSSRWFQSSTTRPSRIRKMFTPLKVARAPVGATSPHGPLNVPVLVQRAATRSPSERIRSTSILRSGNAARKAVAIAAMPAPPGAARVGRQVVPEVVRREDLFGDRNVPPVPDLLVEAANERLVPRLCADATRSVAEPDPGRAGVGGDRGPDPRGGSGGGSGDRRDRAAARADVAGVHARAARGRRRTPGTSTRSASVVDGESSRRDARDRGGVRTVRVLERRHAGVRPPRPLRARWAQQPGLLPAHGRASRNVVPGLPPRRVRRTAPLRSTAPGRARAVRAAAGGPLAPGGGPVTVIG